MGMLNKDDLVNSVMINMQNWDWDINTKFSLTEEEAKAVVEVLEVHMAQVNMRKLRGLM